MAESHFNDPYVTNNATADRRQQDAQKFNQMVQMLAMANRADGQTMLGFALGKLLRGSFDHFKNARDEEARRRGANANITPLTGEALQREENFRHYMNIPTMQEYVQQNAYHGGLSPAQYYGQQLLNGKPQTQQATQAQPTTDTTVQMPSMPTYQARAVEQVMGYSPQSGNYFSASVATTPTDAGTAAKPQSWDSAEKTGTNFSDMLKKYSDLQNAIGGYGAPAIPLPLRKTI